MIFTLTDRQFNVLDAYETEDYLIGKYVGSIIQTLDIDVLVKSENSDKWVHGNYIMCADKTGYKYWFTIYEAEDAYQSDTKSLICYSGTIDIVAEDANPIKRPTAAQPFTYYFNKVFRDTGVRIGTNEIEGKLRKLEFTSENASNAEMLQYVLNGFDNAEADLIVEFDGSIPVGLVLNIYNRIGEVDPQTLLSDEDSSLVSLERTGSIAHLATSIVPIGYEDEDGKQTTILGKDYSELDDDGNVLYYSPAGHNRIYSVVGRSAFMVRLPNKDMGEFDGYINRHYQSEADTSDTLWKAALAKLKELDKPQVIYEAKGHINCNVGDNIQIISHEMKPPVRLSARVLEYKFNDDDPSRNEYTFGNYRVLDSNLDELTKFKKEVDLAISRTYQYINRVEESVVESINHVLTTADGKNSVSYGIDQPIDSRDGDLWYKPVGDGETEMYQLVGGVWTLILSTLDTTKVQQEVEAAQAVADSAKQEAENAYNDAVAEADRLVAAQTEAFDAEMALRKGEINAINADIDAELARVDQAISDNFTSLSGSLDDVEIISNQAKSDAQTASSNASIALSNAATALSNASTALTTAQTAETNISANTTAINLRATKTDVNALAGRVTTAEGTITTQAGQIALMATTTTVNALTGRVSAAESSLSVQSGKIDLAATKTELTTAIKGIQVGGRNLKTGTSSEWKTLNVPTTSWSVPVHGSIVMSDTGLNVGDSMTVGIDIDTSGSLYEYGLRVEQRKDSANRNSVYSEKVGVGKTGRVYITTTVMADRPFLDILLQMYPAAPPRPSQDTVKYRMVMLEKGNKATDWTPAPEDVDASIAVVQSNLTVEAGKITALTTRVSGSETNISNVTQTVSGINTTISTLRTDVNGKATIVSLNSVKATADGNKTTISNHSGRLTTVESNVNGLQTTVSNKADKSQITQLSDAIVLKADKSALASKKDEYTTTITINGNGNTYYPLYFIRGNQSIPRVIRITRLYKDTAPGSIWNPSQPTHPGGLNMEWVGNFGGWGGAVYKAALTSFGEEYTTMLADLGLEHYSQSYAFYLRGGGAKYTISSDQPLNLKVGYSTNDVIFGTNKSSAPKTTVNRSRIDGLITAQNSQITVLSDAINLRVTKGSLMSEINVQAGRTIISTGKLYLDTGSTIMTTAYVNDLKAKSLEAITANITSIRSQILVTDVISSDHIQGGTAMVGKLFSSTASINELTSKTVFVNNIKAINISADRITTGTLNAANVNITNLNVSKIVGLNSTFVQSAWNGINTRISINATELTASDAAGNKASINTSGEFRSTAGGTDKTRGVFHKGRLWFHTTSGSAVLNIGAHPVVGEGVHRGSIATARAEKLVIGRYSDYLTANANAAVNPYISLEYAGVLGDEANAYTKVWHNLSMSGKFINDVQQVSGYELAVRATAGRLMLGVTNHNTLQIAKGNTRSYGNMEMMPGYSVTGTSDERLKNSITPTLISGLEVVNALEYYDYYWNDRPEIGKQFGLIAQRSPFVAEQNMDSGYWGINMNKLSLAAAMAVKEVDTKVSRIDTYVTQHELEIKNLKLRIQQLEEDKY